MILANSGLGTIFAEYPGLLALKPLLALKTGDLTVDHVDQIAKAFRTELPVTEEIRNAAVELLKGRNINEVADMIQQPESIHDLVLFFKEGLSGLQNQRKFERGEYLGNEDLGFNLSSISSL